MQRIDPISRRDDPPRVAPAAPGRRVERREQEADGRQQRRRPYPDTPDGRPDADGHVDVEA